MAGPDPRTRTDAVVKAGVWPYGSRGTDTCAWRVLAGQAVGGPGSRAGPSYRVVASGFPNEARDRASRPCAFGRPCCSARNNPLSPSLPPSRERHAQFGQNGRNAATGPLNRDADAQSFTFCVWKPRGKFSQSGKVVPGSPGAGWPVSSAAGIADPRSSHAPVPDQGSSYAPTLVLFHPCQDAGTRPGIATETTAIFSAGFAAAGLSGDVTGLGGDVADLAGTCGEDLVENCEAHSIVATIPGKVVGARTGNDDLAEFGDGGDWHEWPCVPLQCPPCTGAGTGRRRGCVAGEIPARLDV